MQNPNSSTLDPASAPQRYTPPNQRNRSLNRRRSRVRVNGDRLDQTGSYHSNDGERNQPAAAGFHRGNSSPTIISLEGCCRSEAYQLLSERWAAAMHLYNDPIVDLSERPMMYYGGDVWGKLPHKILTSANKALHPPMLPTDYTLPWIAGSRVAKF